MYSVNQGYLNEPIKKVIEFYFNRHNIKAIISNLEFKNNHLLIDKISLKFVDNTQGEITNFNININSSNIISQSLLSATFNIDKLSIIANKKEEIINTKLSGDYSLNILKGNIISNLNLFSIKSDVLSDEQGANLPDGQAICSYNSENNMNGINCDLKFAKKASLIFNAVVTNKHIMANVKAKNIPLLIYQIVGKIIPDHPIILYMQEHIKSGYIKNGALNLTLDRNFLKLDLLEENTLKANLHLSNFEYKYNQNLPPLTNINTNIIISGSEVKFLINEAYSSKSLLSNGVMTFKWQGLTKSEFVLNATISGEVKDLVDFIPEDDYQNIKNQGIDLKEARGNANSIIEIIIPINPKVENSYNISSNLSNVSLAAFSNNILIQNIEAKGIFQGNKLTFEGKGKINNYPSSFTYDHDILLSNGECNLKVKTNFRAANQRIGVLKLVSGNAILNFEYQKQKNNESFVNINSNLNNLEFYIDKISIHKKLYKKANLVLTTKLSNDQDKNIGIDLSGEDNLRVKGNILVKNDLYNITLPMIKYAQTNLSGNVIVDNNNLIVDLKGDRLDLSNSNMIQFLQKEGDSTHNISLKTNIAAIRLKNNIILNNCNLTIKCDKVKCFTGSLNANIDNKYVKMSLFAKEKFEQWVIDADNAGDLLKGIGMYNNIRNGVMQLMFNTRRFEVKKGEIIPILDGSFIIKRFIITDMPFLTRIVSFVSLPGFISAISNNKNVAFENIEGNFNYKDNIITLVNSKAQGPFFDFTMHGNIDTKKQEITLKGNVIPSFFFISSIITKIPIVGKIFSKVAPYSFKMQYE